MWSPSNEGDPKAAMHATDSRHQRGLRLLKSRGDAADPLAMGCRAAPDEG